MQLLFLLIKPVFLWRLRCRFRPPCLWLVIWISLTTLSFAATKNNFFSVCLPIFKTVVVLPFLFIFEFSKENLTLHSHAFYKSWKICFFRVVVLQRTTEKPTRFYFARVVSLFCLLTVLFGDDVVVVFFNSLMTYLTAMLSHWLTTATSKGSAKL